MTPKQKIKYVKDAIDEKVQISPKGPIYLQLYTLTEYEDGPTLLSRAEQQSIIKKLEEDGHIKNVSFEDDGVGVWFETIAIEQETKTDTALKNKPVIKPKSLELISIELKEHYTTTEIERFLREAGVDDKYITPASKWAMFYQVFYELTYSKDKKDEEQLFKIICDSIHPLNLGGDENKSRELQKKFNEFLKFDGLQIYANDNKGIYVISDSSDSLPDGKESIKTSTDYILEALTFFKNEYNKVPMSGLTYDYSIGENIKSEQTDQDYDEYAARLKAIERLKDAGFITEFTLEERVENDGYYIWDYAVCKIDESKIIQKETSRATEAKVQELIHKIEITGMPPLVIQKDRRPKNYSALKYVAEKDPKAEIAIGLLVSYDDGSIRYDGQILEMRSQLKDLCRLFMSRADTLTTIDRIRNEIIKADKRKTTSFITISKYVSELHTLLQIHFQKPVIFNQKEEGWYFRPPK